jgi:large subunit ribosomal protein L9
VITIAKVLLTKTVERLGHVGEIVTVADGYARNYLFPQALAVEPSEHNIAHFAKERAAHEVELMKREERARLLRDKLANVTLVFERKAHDDERLYGSVRVEDIAAQIEELVGEHIESSRVNLAQPLETLGPHAVTIALYKDISVEVRIHIKKEGAGED